MLRTIWLWGQDDVTTAEEFSPFFLESLRNFRYWANRAIMASYFHQSPRLTCRHSTTHQSAAPQCYFTTNGSSSCRVGGGANTIAPPLGADYGRKPRRSFQNTSTLNIKTFNVQLYNISIGHQRPDLSRCDWSGSETQLSFKRREETVRAKLQEKEDGQEDGASSLRLSSSFRVNSVETHAYFANKLPSFQVHRL